MNKSSIKYLFALVIFFYFCNECVAFDSVNNKEEKRKQDMEKLQERFTWWPTDAKPGPVKDTKRGGYWWWPTTPGKARPWGNRGYVYVYKIIFDYKEEELPPPQKAELRPSLLIKKIIKNVKVYFDYDKADLRDDAMKILKTAVVVLKKNPGSSILITGSCDIRGSEQYNEKLGKKRGESVKQFMLSNEVAEERIRIISRGKLDAIAPVTDLVGMQKDRNAQFMIAEVEEVMIPYPGEPQTVEETPQIIDEAKPIEDGKYLIEKEENIESEIKVSTKEYITQKGDTLWKIAERECGSGFRWKNIYELNKDKIKDPNRLKANQRIEIPVE